MSLIGLGNKPGTCWSHSELDPRWNFTIPVRSILVTSFVLPTEAQEKIEELKKEFGEPPDDLEVYCIKD